MVSYFLNGDSISLCDLDHFPRRASRKKATFQIRRVKVKQTAFLKAI